MIEIIIKVSGASNLPLHSVSRIKLIVGLLIALLLPLACFFWVWNTAGDGHVKMPRYYGKMKGVRTIKVRGQEKQDTLWQQVELPPMINQFGDAFILDSFANNKITILNFFFSTCNTVCPTLNGNMKFLGKRFKKNDSLIRFVSVTVDPMNDTARQLRKYGASIGADFNKWAFCSTQSPRSVKQLMFQELAIPDITATDTAENAFGHSNHWVLLDRDRNIRGYYAALDTLEMRRCADDISLLVLEKKPGDKKRENKMDVTIFEQPKRK